MKRLTLLRHAKSGDDGAVMRDFDRPLNAKGKRAARTIGRHMRAEALRYDAVIASPATRVAETLQEVESGYGGALTPTWERRIYLATPDELLDVVQATADTNESLLLVGHNPGLEQLVLRLVPREADGARGEVEVKYPTATLAEMTFPVERWAEIGEGGGDLVRLVRPRDLDPELGPDYA